MSERLLYRYQSYTKKHVDQLNSRDIWVSDPTLFNDSTDLNPRISVKTDFGPFKNTGHFIDVVQLVFRENPDVNGYWLFGSTDDTNSPASLLSDPQSHLDFDRYFCERVLERIQGFGVTCFAPSSRMPVMWAHYASCGRGYCLEYEAKCTLNSANENSKEGFALMDVDYSTLFKHEYCISEIVFSPHRSLHRLLATKHIDWSHEKETRLICFDEKSTHTAIPSWLRLTRIIPGPNAGDEIKTHLAAKANELGVDFSPA